MIQSIVRVKFAVLAIMAAGTLLRSTPAHAVPILQTRCTIDALNAPAARARLEWARFCGTRVNVVSTTSPVLPAMMYDTGTLAQDGTHLFEYIETNDFWGRNSYSGDSGAGINQIFTQSQWKTGGYTATTDANGFQKWVRIFCSGEKAVDFAKFDRDEAVGAIASGWRPTVCSIASGTTVKLQRRSGGQHHAKKRP